MERYIVYLEIHAIVLCTNVLISIHFIIPFDLQNRYKNHSSRFMEIALEPISNELFGCVLTIPHKMMISIDKCWKRIFFLIHFYVELSAESRKHNLIIYDFNQIKSLFYLTWLQFLLKRKHQRRKGNKNTISLLAYANQSPSQRKTGSKLQ